MEHPSENNFNLFTSFLLGGMGISLLLIPGEIQAFPFDPLGWAFILPGIISFALALSLQIITILPVPNWRVILIQLLAGAFLLVFAWIYLQSGFAIEGGVFFISGIVQLVILLPISKRFPQIDLLSVTLALIGFTAGIDLALNKHPEGYLLTSSYSTHLAVMFLVTAFAGASAATLPTFRYSPLLSKLQALPWLIWSILCIQDGQWGSLIITAAIVLLILFKDFMAWEKIRIPENDILGRRVLMVGATIELTILIFLSALLVIMDRSPNIDHTMFVSARGAAVLFFIIVAIVVNYEVITVLMTINGLMQELTREEEEEDEEDVLKNRTSVWNSRLARYIKPFVLTREGIRFRLIAQADQIQALSRQIAIEKKRNSQLILLMELSQQLENQLDQPVAAQLAVNTLERALNCSLVTIYLHEPERKEFMLLAAAGRQTSLIPPGYRQSASRGALGRAFRQRKTHIINDIRLDAEYIPFENENNQSAVTIPLLYNGHVNGIIVLNSEHANAFSSVDVGLAEAIAAELTRAWERSGYHQRLMELIQAGSQLSSVVDPTATAQDVAAIAKEILQAKFTFVHIQLGQERNFIQSASTGNAPRLLESLTASIEAENIIQIAFQAVQPFRVRDIRKYAATAHLAIDNPGLRSMLTIPIRWHQVNIGGIFAFGKQNEVFFTENDESLAELLSIQAAGAFESTWLQQELRASLRITSLLYRLSNQIILAEDLKSAASDIAQTAHKLARSTSTGIVLFNPDDSIAAEVRIDSAGKPDTIEHPMQLVMDAMASGQLLLFSPGQSVLRTCMPIQTPIRKYGAVWMDAPDDPGHKPATNPNDLQALVNQAAIALERSLLLVESRRQAVEIKAAYDMLEQTYDQTLASLISALDARDRETEGHSMRVSSLAVKVGESLGYSAEQLKILERASILHDIGKIGISDSILHKPGPLNEAEWKIMKMHPDIGAKIVEGIPFLQDTIPVIRHHQERWNGTGYPGGLKGEEIPPLARLFSVVDAFDALTSNRPYRQKISTAEALEYLREEAGILFDPEMVAAFEKMVVENQASLLLPE